MPAKSQPKGKPAAAKPLPVATLVREKMHTEVEVDVAEISYTDMKEFLGWESLKEYVARRGFDGVGEKIATGEFENQWPAMSIVDEYGEKVVCGRNSKNRPFDLATAKNYQQDHVTRKFLFNGESFIIDEYDDVISGQHRGVGFMLAVQLWRRDKYYRRFWPDEPTYKTILVVGVPGSQEVRATLDNVRTRQLSDTFYTSEIFSDLEPAGKKECCRMLDAAVDLLWKRTGMGFQGHANRETHAAAHAFAERHPALVTAVRHLYNQNKERAISLFKLSPGQCSALMYLMAACGTDGKAYRAGDPPREELCDLRYWDKAKDFWSLIAAKSANFVPLLNYLTAVTEGKFGTAQLNDKRIAGIVAAWNLWVAGKKITKDEVEPTWLGQGPPDFELAEEYMQVLGGKGKDGQPVGIDMGWKPEREDERTEEEVKAERKEELARKLAGTPSGAVLEMVRGARAAKPDRLLLFANAEGGWTAFDEDADVLAAALGSKTTERPDGMRMCKAPKTAANVDDLAPMLRIKGTRGVTTVGQDGTTMTDLEPAPKPAPLPGKAKGAASTNANGTQATSAKAPAKQPTAQTPAKGKLRLRPGNASA